MRVVTFYSFKGGVGRTMALINVAAALAERKRRVLIVDFDLEAPGVQTYEPFVRTKNAKGVVEYINSYLQNGEAPDATDFVRQYELNGHSIWLMAAGVQDRSYGARLNAIEWLKLYNEYDGYLMFEDLKQQWSLLKFDYVLIDSRTGHTDVAGICTRQLPEAVVLMFLPNDQNIGGLEDIARKIRMEAEAPRNKKIFLHFCPSNVPDLDDEDLILQRHLEDASSRLEYESVASIIHHYNNLALLDQSIFVQTKPRTRLAQEYERLANAIVAENLEDKNGALSKLEEMRASLREGRRSQDLGAIEEILAQVYKFHRDDGEIAWSLSLVYEMLSNVVAQRETLDIAIRRKFNEARARTKRAQILLRDPTSDMGRDDLRHVLSAKDVTLADLVAGVERLREIDPEWLSAVKSSETIRNLKGTDLFRIVNSLVTSSAGASFAAELLKNREAYAPKGPQFDTHLVLALMGAGRFVEAENALGNKRLILQSSVIPSVFNFACAEWGRTGTPPIDLFCRVIEMAKEQMLDAFEAANPLQCLSMANYLCGKLREAYKCLDRSERAVNSSPPGLIFSCWRYLNVTREEFFLDVSEMRANMKAGQLIPRYMQQLALLA